MIWCFSQVDKFHQSSAWINSGISLNFVKFIRKNTYTLIHNKVRARERERERERVRVGISKKIDQVKLETIKKLHSTCTTQLAIFVVFKFVFPNWCISKKGLWSTNVTNHSLTSLSSLLQIWSTGALCFLHELQTIIKLFDHFEKEKKST